MSNLVKIRDLQQKPTPESTDALEISQNVPRASFFITVGSLNSLFQLISEKDSPNGYAGLNGSIQLDVDQIPNLIPAGNIANGTVDNTEFQSLNGVTSNIQTQLNATEKTANKGAVSGYAGLDSSQELLLTNFPSGSLLQVLRRNAANDALEFATISFAAITSLNSDTAAAQTLSGTSNRITVSDTTPDHAFDISSNYVGQSSITTLGTITAGEWTGTDVDYANIDLDGNVVNTDIDADAAIAFTKLAALTSAKILVGSSSNVATATTMGGDASLANDGTLTLASTVVQTDQANTYSASVLQNFAAADMRIPASASPSISAEGDFALDTSVGSFTAGILVYRDDTEQLGVVSMPIAQFTEPADGDIISYNTTTNDFELGQPVSQEVFTWSNNHSMASFKLTASASKDVILNAPTGQAVSFEVVGTEEYEFNATQADFKGNSINNLAILTSNATNPAVAGTIRLGNAEKIVWRNAINDDDGLTFELTSNDAASLSVLTRSYEFSEALLTLDGADLRNVGSIGIGSNADPAPRELVIDASGEGEIANFRMIGPEGNVTQNMGTEFDWVYNRTSDGAAIIDIQAKPLSGTNKNAIIRFGLQSNSTALNNTLFFDSNGNKMQTQLGSSNSSTYFNRQGGFTSIGKLLSEFQLDVNGDIRTTDDFIMDSGGVKATGTITIDSPVANTFATGTATCVGVVATETLTVNGLTYTAVSTTPDNTQFLVEILDADTATNLASAITDDTRNGTLGDQTAASVGNVVTITTDVLGDSGNAITLAETGDGITISGITLGTGTGTPGVTADTVTLYNNLLYTAVNGAKADNTEFQVDMGTNTATAEKLVESINGDSRAGQGASFAINVIASSAVAVVTLTASVTGTAGNDILLASSNSSTLLTSGTKLGSIISGVDALQLSIASGALNSADRTVSFPGLIANDTFALLGVAQTFTGAKTFGGVADVGKLLIAGITSGTTTLNATAVASGVLTLPAVTDTLVARATTDTLTNKTLTQPAIGNFTSATHNHTNAVGGNQLNALNALNASGTTDGTTFLRGDNTWAVPPAQEFTGSWTTDHDAGGFNLNSLADPTLVQDAVTKNYDDSANGFKGTVTAKMASTENIDLSGGDPGATIDGVTLVTNSRVLLKDQGIVDSISLDSAGVYNTGDVVTVVFDNQNTGGGSGATASVAVNGGTGALETLTLLTPGSGYKFPPVIIFVPGLAFTTEATATAIINSDQNGLYDAVDIDDTSTWIRTTDADSITEVNGLTVFVAEGTANANLTFIQTETTVTLFAPPSATPGDPVLFFKKEFFPLQSSGIFANADEFNQSIGTGEGQVTIRGLTSTRLPNRPGRFAMVSVVINASASANSTDMFYAVAEDGTVGNFSSGVFYNSSGDVTPGAFSQMVEMTGQIITVVADTSKALDDPTALSVITDNTSNFQSKLQVTELG